MKVFIVSQHGYRKYSYLLQWCLFGLSPLPLEIQFSLILSLNNFDPSPPWNFHWPSLGWIWIFSGTVQHYLEITFLKATQLKEVLNNKFDFFLRQTGHFFFSFCSLSAQTIQHTWCPVCPWTTLVFRGFVKQMTQSSGGRLHFLPPDQALIEIRKRTIKNQ